MVPKPQPPKKPASSPSAPSSAVTAIALEQIRVAARARDFVPAHVQELVLNIADVGLIHPITVTPDAAGFVLVAGRHRLEAYRALQAEGGPGYDKIPAIVIASADARRIELCENLYRHDLSVLEKAEHLDAYLRLTSEPVSQAIEQLARAARQSERSFFRYKAIGSGLQVGAEIRKYHPELANSTRQLYYLATRCGKDEQKAVLRLLRTMPELSVQQAHARLGGEPGGSCDKAVPVLVPSSLRNRIGSLSKSHRMKKGEFMQHFLAAALQAYEQGRFELP